MQVCTMQTDSVLPLDLVQPVLEMATEGTKLRTWFHATLRSRGVSQDADKFTRRYKVKCERILCIY